MTRAEAFEKAKKLMAMAARDNGGEEGRSAGVKFAKMCLEHKLLEFDAQVADRAAHVAERASKAVREVAADERVQAAAAQTAAAADSFVEGINAVANLIRTVKGRR